MNTASVKRDLLAGLRGDLEYRHAWNLENVYTGVCFQLRALREQRGWSQAALGKAARMAQERISILEDPNSDTKPTLNTLLRLADACDVGLDVRFVPYKTVIDRSVNTDLKTLEVPSFDEELPGLEREIELEATMTEIENAISSLVNIGDFRAKRFRNGSPVQEGAAASMPHGNTAAATAGGALRELVTQRQADSAGNSAGNLAIRIPPHSANAPSDLLSAIEG